MHGEYSKMKTIIDTDEDNVKLEDNDSPNVSSLELNTMDIVDIMASFESKPLISDTLAFQFPNPANLNIGEMKFPRCASILFELSSVNLKCVSNDCKNHTITEELKIIIPTFSKKSFDWSFKWRYKFLKDGIL